ncbi:hypothetical protein HanHA300_Chr10g0350331 [Helianthus annuus]|nr:hypothetical protein HanHA300_Chr10g0350331 [Helianthus annuus]KAJ0528925.1 hypothetical protein HanHA89_Chr10g0371881 [Helianthus annuus]KAJ0695840.1 hypothetical protein HanLR1_Chr10g0350091 [Helianthus annuus]
MISYRSRIDKRTHATPIALYGTYTTPIGPYGIYSTPIGLYGTYTTPIDLYRTCTTPIGLYVTYTCHTPTDGGNIEARRNRLLRDNITLNLQQ